jgi:hypothetical protein
MGCDTDNGREDPDILKKTWILTNTTVRTWSFTFSQLQHISQVCDRIKQADNKKIAFRPLYLFLRLSLYQKYHVTQSEVSIKLYVAEACSKFHDFIVPSKLHLSSAAT